MKKLLVLTLCLSLIAGCRSAGNASGGTGGTSPVDGPAFNLVDFMAAAQTDTNITVFAKAFTKVANGSRSDVLPFPQGDMDWRIPKDEAMRRYLTQKGQTEAEFLASSGLKFFVQSHLFYYPAKTAEERASFLNIPGSANAISGLKVEAQRITPDLCQPKTSVPWEEKGCEIKLIGQGVEARPFRGDVALSKPTPSGLKGWPFLFIDNPLVK